MNTTVNLFDGFESEVIASTTLPYAQIHNPPNINLSQIEQLNLPFGWFISTEQAELASFQQDKHWQPTQLTFGEDSSSPRIVDGFIARKLRLIVLHQSQIEVQEKTTRGWQYLGVAYRQGNLTPHGELAQKDRNNFRLRTRYLVMFLDSDNHPLNSIPFKIGMNAGVGAAFATEVREFRSEIETVFFQSIGKPQQSLSIRAHALTVLDMELGVHKSEGKSPYIYPSVRSTPTSSVSVQRRDRVIQLLEKPLQSLIIPKKSEVGRTILSLHEQYESFSTQERDELAPETEPEVIF